VRAVLRLMIAALPLVLIAPPSSAADLSEGTHKTHVHKKHHAKHARTGRIRYGGAPGLGYWRKGPERGYGFAFSTYKGDPFGKDDYYDGDRCFYVRGHDYCDKRRIWTGFNTFNRPRYLHPLAAE
jgi:hypothetical protein